MWKGALLVCGEPGTGKSRWIREEAVLANARIFRWNARIDRSLRDGREKLHQQVRSREPLFVWIEGADDLTQEAQAFLRRILETASSNVVCALEVRELWKMSPPVLSRCTIISMKSSTSFRKQRNIQRAVTLGLLESNPPLGTASWSEIPALRQAAADPYEYLESLILKDTTNLTNAGIEAFRAVGAGSSPWIQLAQYLMSSAEGIKLRR
jgi:replication-associated recombination protein RarA